MSAEDGSPGQLRGAAPATVRGAGGEAITDALAERRRAQAISGLRGLTRQRPEGAAGRGAAAGASGPGIGSAPVAQASRQGAGEAPSCDICGTALVEDHRHLLQLYERRIECVCESCWALRSGEPEYRPTGSRIVWLAELKLPDELWASLQIPIGLAFFMQSSTAGCVVALYPSPAGATESELHFTSWNRMVELNPLLDSLEPDVEGLIVDRLSEPPAYLIAPIDRCYAAHRTREGELAGPLRRGSCAATRGGFPRGAAPRGAGVVSAERAPSAAHEFAQAAAGARMPQEIPSEPPAEVEPDFSVLSARPLRHAAAPTLLLDLQVSEPSGRPVYMIALTIQLMIEPARRAYDEHTHVRLEGLFGPPERWAVTTRSLVLVTARPARSRLRGLDDGVAANRLRLRHGGRGEQVLVFASRR